MLVANIAILLERFADGVFEFRRNFRIQAHRRSWCASENSLENFCRSLSSKWLSAGSHFVEHDSEAEEIAARIQLPSTGLLGRHIGDRTQDRAGNGLSVSGSDVR